jgi:hypothetical protein
MIRKRVIIPVIILSIILLITFFPIPEEPSKNLSQNTLMESFSVQYTGFMGGTSERYKIFENGTVLYEFNPQNINHTVFNTSLSEDRLQRLNDFIGQKRYSQKTHSILYAWLASYYAEYSSEIIIKDGQKTVKINNDSFISELLSTVRKESLDFRMKTEGVD